MDKRDGFIVRSEDPLSGGPPGEVLVASFITPTDAFFVRNHAPIPVVDLEAFRLRVGGLVAKRASFSLDELASHFPFVEVDATMQCAGNRRDELIAIKPVTGEVQWGAEAISTAKWGGVRLRDVLEWMLVKRTAAFVGFTGLDAQAKDGGAGYGASISLERAMAADVLLATHMNGEPLPGEHGAPLRVVVPGYVGARSVKWLTAIELRATPSDAYHQAHAYKLFESSVTAAKADWDVTPPIEAMQLSAVICLPTPDADLVAGPLEIEGWATAGGSRTVATVEVSADGGSTWRDATFLDGAMPGTWRRWRCHLQVSAGPAELVVRAQDSGGAGQPADVAGEWNFKGYMNQAWHRVPVVIR